MASGPFDLTGKQALVTGATRGIGLAIVELLTELGARIVVSSESAQDCEAVAARLGGLPLACDLADMSAVTAMPAQVRELAGHLDILVLNAGIPGAPGPFAALDHADYRHVMAVNLESTVLLAKGLLPLIATNGGGAAILMSSIAGLRGNGAISSYALSKAAIAQLARNLAVEWGPRNVRVNAVSPGLIETPLSKPLLQDADFMARRLQMTPLRRTGRAHEVAGAVAFLASAAGAFVTGHNLVVDGGTLVTDGS